MNQPKFIPAIMFFAVSILTNCSQPMENLHSINVFAYTEGSGDTFGYRIPAMVTTGKGTVLAFAKRRQGLHDHAQNDIVLRRSSLIMEKPRFIHVKLSLMAMLTVV